MEHDSGPYRWEEPASPEESPWYWVNVGLAVVAAGVLALSQKVYVGLTRTGIGFALIAIGLPLAAVYAYKAR